MLGMMRVMTQGSVFEPFLWNFLYDPVLKLALPRGCIEIAYAVYLAGS